MGERESGSDVRNVKRRPLFDLTLFHAAQADTGEILRRERIGAWPLKRRTQHLKRAGKALKQRKKEKTKREKLRLRLCLRVI